MVERKKNHVNCHWNCLLWIGLVAFDYFFRLSQKNRGTRLCCIPLIFGKEEVLDYGAYHTI